ncbi:hypothetical protein ACEPAG_9668 [Sanghuangporus baumii]
MFGLYRRVSWRGQYLRFRAVLALLSIIMLTDSIVAQMNVTLDDTDLYIIYAPAQSWHASTVECDACLSPPSTSAHGGTWHDGTHIIPTVDEDDEGTVGDLDGDGATSTSATPVSSTVAAVTSSSSSQSAQTSAASDVNTNNNDDDDDDDDDGGGDKHGGKGNDGRRKRRLKRSIRSAKWIFLTAKSNLDDENPFEVQSVDSDDPGFQDIPVTATLNFSGQAVYVFAILPLFPAPSNTTPTFTNLSFTLDGAPHGSFTYRPDAIVPGTPNINSSAADKFQFDVNIFSVSDLEDSDHSLVINVGVDSVLLLDYVIYTAGASDPTIPGGSITTAAPGSERTAGSATSS